MTLCDIHELNRRILKDAKTVVLQAEEKYANLIQTIAHKLISRVDKRPIVFLSGPSGSGKTTTGIRICNYLAACGYTAHNISTDNYFSPNEISSMPLDELGNPDLESPDRLDLELLIKHIGKILECREITFPLFDFPSQTRLQGAKFLRKPGELVVIEGIHTLNPKVSGLYDDMSSKIYVSVRTRLVDESCELMHPSKIRLARRLIRDSFFRGRTPEQTLAHFVSVNRGEELHIMPFKYRAEYEIDTFIDYEMSAYRDFLLNISRKLAHDGNEICEQVHIFLSKLTSISLELIPSNSLVREFIGGSCLKYNQSIQTL